MRPLALYFFGVVAMVLTQGNESHAQSVSPLTSAIVESVSSPLGGYELINRNWGGTSKDHGGKLTIVTVHMGQHSWYQAFIGKSVLKEVKRELFRRGNQIGYRITWSFNAPNRFTGLFLFQVGKNDGSRTLEARCTIQ